MAARTIELALRVPYAHVDQMGVVYYAHYFVYFEMARSALLREAGLPYPELERRGVLLPVVEAHCTYLSPAHYDELILIRTCCKEIRKARLRIEYEVVRDNTSLASGYTEHVCLSREGKVLRPLPELWTLLSTEQCH
ncbi:MAG: acyl-CoA thioesterase [Kiritimatiellia bacterium]